MKSIQHCYYIQNGRPVDRRYYLVSMSESALEVYEVLRLIEGVPLFLEDHFLRMKRSARLINNYLHRSLPEIEYTIRRLVEANRVTSGKVKLLVQWEEKKKGELYACFIPHRYPTEKQAQEGVRVGTMQAERENPNAKVTRIAIRETADRLMIESKLYEVLLINDNDEITEGSRSNFFGISGKKLITPPLRTVLPGITRRKIMELAPSLGLEVEERLIPYETLGDFEAVFLTGTSPGVLPIRAVNDRPFPATHEWLVKLRDAYKALVKEYVRSHNSVLVGA